MSRNIAGITYINSENNSIFLIESFSSELQESIRTKLSAVCHGVANSETEQPMFCYKNTLIEFINRYCRKTENQKKGMIGELLLHILMVEYLDDYQVNSPFFNMEERSAKKGFDVILNKKETSELWFAEVKSGELHSDKDTNQTVIDLINNAHHDILTRLESNNSQLWLNAVNSARNAISEARNERDAIIKILGTHGSEACQGTLSSTGMNVILVGTIFNDLADRICKENISLQHTAIMNAKKFHQVYLIAIQKKTYSAVYDFLKRESHI